MITSRHYLITIILQLIQKLPQENIKEHHIRELTKEIQTD
ncbi:unnamed protein product [Acanthoscelides obtectus]|uniref:Uncharacterized protein n=1 Tax=Acanthoscelides obtectus TaxID=200917 RepID=A0A9P0LVK9_ACAOB|nr:unnamed protein product [Acanthoscelides obtectus]CAK1652103.1 hypothetical protein AOBTE_LOCUS17684 [Acanthoscelides obtectus]